MEFYQTVLGRKYYERDVPRIAVALESIADGLQKLNEEKVQNNVSTLNELKDLVFHKTLEDIAKELETYEPALSRLLRQYL